MGDKTSQKCHPELVSGSNADADPDSHRDSMTELGRFARVQLLAAKTCLRPPKDFGGQAGIKALSGRSYEVLERVS